MIVLGRVIVSTLIALLSVEVSYYSYFNYLLQLLSLLLRVYVSTEKENSTKKPRAQSSYKPITDPRIREEHAVTRTKMN